MRAKVLNAEPPVSVARTLGSQETCLRKPRRRYRQQDLPIVSIVVPILGLTIFYIKDPKR